jgi:uroporphyrinogen-III decarboxylase
MIEQDTFGVRPIPAPQNMEAFFDWNIKRYHTQLDSLEWLDDDRVPHVTALMGTDIFAGAFGCPVYYPGDTNPYARALVSNAKEAAALKKPKLENSSLMKAIEFGMKLKKEAPDALIQLPDIQSPLDIAAIIWEKVDFFMAMYDESNAVKNLISMTHELLTEFLDLWFKTFGKDFIAHYPEYYMPYGITLSEDEIGSINTDLFKEFSYPSLCELSSHFGGRIGIHCCANAKHQWGLIKSIPGLCLLNLGQKNETIREASAFFAGKPPIWAAPDQNECHDFHSRAVLLGHGDSKENTIEELKRLKEYSRNFHE